MSPWSQKASPFLHSSVLISFGRKTRCGWQIISEKGSGNCLFCSVPVLPTDGPSECWKCSGPPHTPSACEWWALPAFFLLSISNFQKNCLDLYLFFFFFNIKLNHIYGEVLSHLFYSPLIIYIFFGIEKILKMLVQAGMNGCQQFFQTCEKIYFLPENYTYGLEW